MVNWTKGDDVRPVPEDGLYLAGEKILMPAMNIVSEAYNLSPSFAGRNKLLRAAAISYAKNKDWKPSDKFNSIKPMINTLVNHKLWEKMEILGAMIHLIIAKHEAAVTIDIAAKLGAKGLGLVSIWPDGLGGANNAVPWAEMGSAVATLADRGIMIDVCSLIQVSDDKIKIDLHNGDEVLQAWVDALDLAKANRRRLISATMQKL